MKFIGMRHERTLILVIRAIIACAVLMETWAIVSVTLRSTCAPQSSMSASAAVHRVQTVASDYGNESSIIVAELNKSRMPLSDSSTIALVAGADEVDVISMSTRHVEPASNISAAICFKTLFGDIDLGIVLQWAAYNRLIGFDHIFMFYRPEMTNKLLFEELRSLPYVTLTLNTGGTRDNYYGQVRTETLCLEDEKYAAGYDWALLADIDEYLWFPEHVGVKEFLTQHSQLNYLSFGKRMYTLDHRNDMEAVDHAIDMGAHDGFSLKNYPFYIDNFCYKQGSHRGNPFCPTWRGRAKVIVRPMYYTRIDTHGNIKNPDPANGTIHFLTEQAHFMEWPEIFAKHNVTQRDAVDFYIRREEEVHIHNLKRAFRSDSDGNFLMKYDDKLAEWFSFVASRFSAAE